MDAFVPSGYARGMTLQQYFIHAAAGEWGSSAPLSSSEKSVICLGASWPLSVVLRVRRERH